MQVRLWKSLVHIIIQKYSKLARLNPIYNKALRFATNAFRSTQVTSFYAETGFVPLSSYNDEYIVAYAILCHKKTNFKLSQFLANVMAQTIFDHASFSPWILDLKNYL